MRLAIQACLGLITAIVLAGLAHADSRGPSPDPDQSLTLYAVHVLRVPRENWTGLGVYMGHGLILTAAHVVGLTGAWIGTEIEIAGKVLPAHVIKQGSFSDVDLALAAIDEQQLPVSLRLRRMTICSRPPFPGEEVISVIPERIARSHVIAPAALPKGLDAKFRTAMVDTATTGASGSGVFDANRQCLLGIVSAMVRRSYTRVRPGKTTKGVLDVARYFVPAPVITKFIPPDYHF